MLRTSLTMGKVELEKGEPYAKLVSIFNQLFKYFFQFSFKI